MIQMLIKRSKKELINDNQNEVPLKDHTFMTPKASKRYEKGILDDSPSKRKTLFGNQTTQHAVPLGKTREKILTLNQVSCMEIYIMNS